MIQQPAQHLQTLQDLTLMSNASGSDVQIPTDDDAQPSPVHNLKIQPHAVSQNP